MLLLMPNLIVLLLMIEDLLVVMLLMLINIKGVGYNEFTRRTTFDELQELKVIAALMLLPSFDVK